ARGGATPSRGIARAVGFPLRVLDGGIRCRPGDVADALGERTVVRRNQPFAFGGSPAGLIDILRHVAGPLARIVEGAPCSTPHLFTRFRPGLLLETRLRQHGAEAGADREADGAREERLALDGGDETAAAITHAVSAAIDPVTAAIGDTLPPLPRVIRKIADAAAGFLAPVADPIARIVHEAADPPGHPFGGLAGAITIITPGALHPACVVPACCTRTCSRLPCLLPQLGGGAAGTPRNLAAGDIAHAGASGRISLRRMRAMAPSRRTCVVAAMKLAPVMLVPVGLPVVNPDMAMVGPVPVAAPEDQPRHACPDQGESHRVVARLPAQVVEGDRTVAVAKVTRHLVHHVPRLHPVFQFLGGIRDAAADALGVPLEFFCRPVGHRVSSLTSWASLVTCRAVRSGVM